MSESTKSKRLLASSQTYDLGDSILARLDDEVVMSDEEVIEEQELLGCDWSVIVSTTKKALLNALPASDLRVRVEAQREAYRRFRPLLLLALSKLAHIGVRCPPVRALRLIRAFFDAQPMREEWVASHVIDAFLSFAHARAAFEFGGAK